MIEFEPLPFKRKIVVIVTEVHALSGNLIENSKNVNLSMDNIPLYNSVFQPFTETAI